MKNNFNLVTDKWIDTDKGLASLYDLFFDTSYQRLTDNAFIKIGVFYLLRCIAQRSYTPVDDRDFKLCSLPEFQQKVTEYLTDHKDLFYLYGDKPFLQFPVLKQYNSTKKTSLGAFIPFVACGNTVCLTQYSVDKKLSDAQKAKVLVTVQAVSLAGKRIDNSIVITPGYKGKLSDKNKPSSGCVSPFFGYSGALNSFFVGSSVADSVMRNLLTLEDIKKNAILSLGLGKPCWELDITGEDCPDAEVMRYSYLGRLVPLVRFCYIDGDEITCTDGIKHLTEKDGVVPLSMTYMEDPKKGIKVKNADPQRKPWRDLTALLSYLDSTSNSGWRCKLLAYCFDRATFSKETVGIWSGGLKVKTNSGEQKVSGGDDFVESYTEFDVSTLRRHSFYSDLVLVLDKLEKKEFYLRRSIVAFYSNRGSKDDNKPKLLPEKNVPQVKAAKEDYWRQCDLLSEQCIKAVESGLESEAMKQFLLKTNQIALKVYDSYCHASSSADFINWVKYRPHFKSEIK
ncbi:type I-E CRISPR-associated protein Cse1/CasA [Succinatimonas hippei]|uniref:type I-E CRISPR-associated protein Cse1/CasA n=1 Tax=Succinatimonas hippei TaxID=626938 RepID=UPI002010E12E|nr:type I-E CRISPR-associated protein Cse1/CasA [Succinatimonas hippei]MCL1603281.1 type I-E CRISPR-associated protein Cse1/CasA [Succinatimonas hippei]